MASGHSSGVTGHEFINFLDARNLRLLGINSALSFGNNKSKKRDNMNA
jgi:hypothetical protein